jgi:hypothetical protein
MLLRVLIIVVKGNENRVKARNGLTVRLVLERH